MQPQTRAGMSRSWRCQNFIVVVGEGALQPWEVNYCPRRFGCCFGGGGGGGGGGSGGGFGCCRCCCCWWWWWW